MYKRIFIYVFLELDIKRGCFRNNFVKIYWEMFFIFVDGFFDGKRSFYKGFFGYIKLSWIFGKSGRIVINI